MLYPIPPIIDYFAVVIGRPNANENQQHIGFLYKDAEESGKFLHLEWHNRLKNENPDYKYQVIDIDLEEIEKIHLAAYCALVYDKNGNQIPYNFYMDNSFFDMNGVFHNEEEYSGLTCATFVLKLFSAQGYHLIDFTTWKAESKNKDWQRRILGYLKSYLSTGYFDKLNVKIKYGISRFKPEEVAAAAALIDSRPNTKKSLEQLSKQILGEIVSYSKSIA